MAHDFAAAYRRAQALRLLPSRTPEQEQELKRIEDRIEAVLRQSPRTYRSA